MEGYVGSIRRHVLFVTLVLLAVLGNEPHRTVHAQVGTTKLRSATTLAAPGGGRTTVVTARTTQQGVIQTTQVAGAGQPYATTNIAPTQRATGGVNTGAAVVPQTTPGAGGIATQAPGGAATVGPGGGGAVASTQKAVIATTRKTAAPGGATQQDSASSSTASSSTTPTQAAQTTLGFTGSTASPSKLNEFNIGYLFKILSPLQGNEDSCINEARKDLANTFGISTSRVTEVTCTAGADKDTINVTAKITPGSKPTIQDLENFKARSDYTTVRFNGWQNRIGEIVRESFQFEKVTNPSASASGKNNLGGLSEAHWVMIGMGTVILLLFIVSITIICIGRRGGEGSRERMDEEASASSEAASEADSEDEPKKKWYSFLQRRKKGDDDSDGNRTDDESAYESAKGDDGSESDEGSEKIHDDHKVV